MIPHAAAATPAATDVAIPLGTAEPRSQTTFNPQQQRLATRKRPRYVPHKPPLIHLFMQRSSTLWWLPVYGRCENKYCEGDNTLEGSTTRDLARQTPIPWPCPPPPNIDTARVKSRCPRSQRSRTVLTHKRSHAAPVLRASRSCQQKTKSALSSAAH